MDIEIKMMIERTAMEAASTAVAKTLTSLGIDQSNPIQVQQDMAALKEIRALVDDPEFQQDMLYIRKWRKAMDGVSNKGMLTVATLIFGGIAAMVWIGFQQLLGKG